MRDVRLNNDVGPCSSDGLVVAASDITLDLNGHKIFGTQRANVGIRVESVNNVTVTGGTVAGFGVGVRGLGDRLGLGKLLCVRVRVELADGQSRRGSRRPCRGQGARGCYKRWPRVRARRRDRKASRHYRVSGCCARLTRSAYQRRSTRKRSVRTFFQVMLFIV